VPAYQAGSPTKNPLSWIGTVFRQNASMVEGLNYTRELLMNVWLIIRPDVDGLENEESKTKRNSITINITAGLIINVYKTLEHAQKDHKLTGGLLLQTDSVYLKGVNEFKDCLISSSGYETWGGEEKSPTKFYIKAVLENLGTTSDEHGEFYKPTKEHIQWLNKLKETTGYDWYQ
jgi:hypothetical protein